MSIYKQVMVLVDLTPASQWLIERARAIAPDAALNLLHVINYVPVEPLGETVLPSMQLETELLARDRQLMHQLCAQWGVAEERCHVVIGTIKSETARLVATLQCDLVVVGHHERRGLMSWLNFTEDAVLHATTCDVLAVHLTKSA